MRAVPVDSALEGRQVLFLWPEEEVCPECEGSGPWDSCFRCGNQGAVRRPVTSARVRKEDE